MDAVADYDVDSKIGSDSSYDYYLAAAPERLDVDVSNVVITTQKRRLNKDVFAKLCKYLSTASECDHEFVAEVYEVGQEEELFYMVSEWLDEGSLADPVRDIDRQDVLEIIAEASQGAHALHEVGITHDDINPRNILLGSKTKLAHLGILPTISPGQTLAGTQSSTPIDYKSPAMIQGEAPGRQSDIWALGVTLHKALTGTSIYPNLPDDSLLSSVRYVIANEPKLSDALRNGERRIIERALAINLAQPYETCLELTADLEAEAKRQLEMLDA